jgi:amino acid transporter
MVWVDRWTCCYISSSRNVTCSTVTKATTFRRWWNLWYRKKRGWFSDSGRHFPCHIPQLRNTLGKFVVCFLASLFVVVLVFFFFIIFSFSSSFLFSVTSSVSSYPSLLRCLFYLPFYSYSLPILPFTTFSSPSHPSFLFIVVLQLFIIFSSFLFPISLTFSVYSTVFFFFLLHLSLLHLLRVSSTTKEVTPLTRPKALSTCSYIICEEGNLCTIAHSEHVTFGTVPQTHNPRVPRYGLIWTN